MEGAPVKLGKQFKFEGFAEKISAVEETKKLTAATGMCSWSSGLGDYSE